MAAAPSVAERTAAAAGNPAVRLDHLRLARPLLCVEPSRRRGCKFAAPPSPSLLKHPQEGEGVAAE